MHLQGITTKYVKPFTELTDRFIYSFICEVGFVMNRHCWKMENGSYKKESSGGTVPY
jgi:hypothetical protein